MRSSRSGGIQKGDVVVIRYEGPAGGPGMREMLSPTSAIARYGTGSRTLPSSQTARFSGATRGAAIGHVSPEAVSGGNDRLCTGRRYDFHRHPELYSITLEVSDEELEERKADHADSGKKDHLTGYLKRYAKLVSSADKGAIINR